MTVSNCWCTRILKGENLKWVIHFREQQIYISKHSFTIMKVSHKEAIIVRQKQPSVVFYRKRCSWKFRKIHRKTPVPCQSLGPATLLKKRLWRRCFPVNFAKFPRTPFLQHTSRQLLLVREGGDYLMCYWYNFAGINIVNNEFILSPFVST